jgi:hypothetical protein
MRKLSMSKMLTVHGSAAEDTLQYAQQLITAETPHNQQQALISAAVSNLHTRLVTIAS